jgi:Xaa-Pro aminopeptidase
MKRLSALQRRLRLDALFVVTDINRLYFTGLEASNGALLAQATRPPAFYTDFRYLAMARKHAAWLPSRTLWKTADEQETVAGLGRSWRRVGYEGGIPAARFLKLRQALPDAEWIDIAPDIAELRAVKSPAEQRLMRAAVAANDALFARLVKDSVTPGVSEWTLRGAVRVLADALGHGEAFDTIVCAGRNGAECHHHPDDTVLRRGQPLLVDVGIKLNHYCSDMTRCVHLGTPAPLWRDVYRIVLEANQRPSKPSAPACRAATLTPWRAA